jgi:protein-L-isoaspartate(D-aspartate) O-methyltransferase
VLHIGAGTGYYTALIATCVGGSGHVAAIEADAALSAAARRNLAAMPWVDVRHGDGMARSDEPFDAVLVNAGVTHPHERWLDALVDGGRIVVPLTVAMGQTIGKGPLFLLTRASNDSFDARLLTLVTIYSSVSGRDPAIEQELGARMKANPFGFMSVARFRRDAHPISPSCWVHTPTGCFAACE